MQKRTRRGLVALSAAVVVAGVAAVGVAMAGTGEPDGGAAAAPSSATGTTTGTPSASTTTAAPSTASSSAPAPSPTSTPTAPDGDGGTAPGRTVSVVLAYAEWNADAAQVEAAGFVGEAVEEGGVCTLRLTGPGTPVALEQAAEADATTTNCGAFTVPGDQLAAGQWQLTLSYRSATSAGSSEPATVAVQAR